jgi:hypothetical protein
MHMKIISFDVGIKNMAYCIIDASSSQILDWNVLNLMPQQAVQHVYPCNCRLKTKSKTGEPYKLCGHKSVYQKDDHYFCKKHAFAESRYLIPEKEFSGPSLKKLKYEGLLEIATKYKVYSAFEKPPSTKKDLLAKMLVFFEQKSMQVLKVAKTKSSLETDLITIGRNMANLLDQTVGLDELTHVIIENQISVLANRMKTIQGMLAQYFIMRCRPDIVIEFISSANKLKGFTENAIAINEETGPNPNYKQHKKDSVDICRRFLAENPQLNQWIPSLDNVKRDDLADSFLQGIWYLKSRKIISYAENLKINIVSLS